MLNYLDLIDSGWMWAVLVPVLALLVIDGSSRLIQYLMLDVPASDAESFATRVYQIQRLRRSRLAPLLRTAGLSVERYGSTFTVRQLRSQVDDCERCAMSHDSDAQNPSAGCSILDIARCPNQARIRAGLRHSC